MTLADIRRQVREGIAGLYDCEDDQNGSITIETPFIFPNGDLLDLSVEQTSDGFVVSDLGETCGWLFRVSGIDNLTPARHQKSARLRTGPACSFGAATCAISAKAAATSHWACIRSRRPPCRWPSCAIPQRPPRVLRACPHFPHSVIPALAAGISLRYAPSRLPPLKLRTFLFRSYLRPFRHSCAGRNLRGKARFSLAWTFGGGADAAWVGRRDGKARSALEVAWIPACAGMTEGARYETRGGAGLRARAGMREEAVQNSVQNSARYPRRARV